MIADMLPSLTENIESEGSIDGGGASDGSFVRGEI